MDSIFTDKISFGFEYPYIAIAVFFIILAAIIISKRLKNPFAASISLGPPQGTPLKPPINLKGLIRTLRFIEYFGVILLIICAASPEIRITKTVWQNRGADILFVLDISPSMSALDMDGQSRFNAAKKLLINFCERRPSDSIGLVAVGSDAAMLIPPTSDREVIADRLENLMLGELGDGTALGTGLATAAYHLENSAAPRRAVVLISDGENNAGAIHPHTAAKMLADTGISFWVIGIGSGGEVPVDYTDPFTRIRRTGLYDSRYDTDSLKKIASAGNGTWIQAASADALEAAFFNIDEKEIIVRRAGTVTQSLSYHSLFLIIAVSLIIGANFIKRFFLGAWV